MFVGVWAGRLFESFRFPAVGGCVQRRSFQEVPSLHMSTQVSLRPDPVAGLCGPGMTCFHVRLPSESSFSMCDDRLSFDPLGRLI